MWSPKHRFRLGNRGVTEGVWQGTPPWARSPAMLPCWTFDLLLEAATGSMRVERHASSAKSECTDVMGEESGICRCLERGLPLPRNHLFPPTKLKCRKDWSEWDKKVSFSEHHKNCAWMSWWAYCFGLNKSSWGSEPPFKIKRLTSVYGRLICM